MRKYLTGRIKSEILYSFRGGLCLQFFPHPSRRAFLSVPALHYPQLLSFLLALIVAQTHGPTRLPRSPVPAASFRTSLPTSAARSALRSPRRFLRLADVDKGAFDRLGRYEAALWRQVRQTIFTLEDLRWRASTRSWRRKNTWRKKIGDDASGIG